MGAKLVLQWAEYEITSRGSKPPPQSGLLAFPISISSSSLSWTPSIPSFNSNIFYSLSYCYSYLLLLLRQLIYFLVFPFSSSFSSSISLQIYILIKKRKKADNFLLIYVGKIWIFTSNSKLGSFSLVLWFTFCLFLRLIILPWTKDNIGKKWIFASSSKMGSLSLVLWFAYCFFFFLD